MDYARRGILKHGDNDPYLYCVEGSIFFQEKSVFEAVRSYERARDAFAKIRPESEMGDVLSELGFAYCFSGSFFKGRRLLEYGVKLLEAQGPSGFLIRARRKLAIIYRLSGRFSAAAAQRRKALQLAEDLKMFDQLSQLE
jgi:tetratricopeptide (TPR) repeat protein